ncbi:MAG: hypothetical protein J6R29_01100 [Clostridia bacterium]|nr:hypothetical protein [Clostridia bacterium]
MIKSFYKTKFRQKIFFEKQVKIRTYAFGKEVRAEFLDWRKRHLARWNNEKFNYLLCEYGDVGGNTAKINTVAEVRVVEPRNEVVIAPKKEGLMPLWFEGMFLEVDKEGDLFIDGKKAGIYLGTELKAWGATAIWKNNMPTYLLFVVGKNKSGSMAIYGYEFNNENRPTEKIVVQKSLEATLNRKSKLFCFGKNLFLIHGMRLHYYYYNEEKRCLEEVAIKTDDLNLDKECCNGVLGSVVCDSNGYVHWRTSNKVYSFPIGYPKKLNCIDLGERVELDRIQCFGNNLFVYRRNKITREYSCLKYSINSYGEFDGQVFNTGARYNLFYGDKSGILYYVKLPSQGRKAIVATHNNTAETTIGIIDVNAEETFSVNGNLYLDCVYAGHKITT